MSNWPAAYASYGPEILGFLARRLGSPEEAEDLTQETFIRALDAHDRLRDSSKLRAYLLRIARNLMIDLIRKKQRTAANISEYSTVVEIQTQGRNRHTGPESDLAATEFSQRLQAELELLPLDQKIAFEQGVVLGRPYSEIADQTGWSIGKVKINVFRARKALMVQLRDYRQEMA